MQAGLSDGHEAAAADGGFHSGAHWWLVGDPFDADLSNAVSCLLACLLAGAERMTNQESFLNFCVCLGVFGVKQKWGPPVFKHEFSEKLLMIVLEPGDTGVCSYDFF